MKYQLADIGVNLTSSSFEHDRDAVVARALAAGVEKMVLIGSDLKDSKSAIALCEGYRGCVSTAGIHPHNASSYNEEILAALKALGKHPCVRAIGEAGLDFNRNYSTPAEQLEAFAAQLRLAAETGLPIYLHQRDAHDAFIDLLKEYRNDISRAVVHCFTGDEQELEDYLALDLHIGITGWICDERRGYHLHHVIGQIPPHRLMIETDAPYLLPRNIAERPKPRRNEPAFLPNVLTMVAQVLRKSEAEVAHTTYQTAEEFFHRG